jgi:uncharacterized protein
LPVLHATTLAMISTDALFRIGDAAEESGDYDLARASFEKGASFGDEVCLTRLARMFDLGLGCEADRAAAMRCYQKAWRRGSEIAANNIAILYREAGNPRAKFRWFKRAVDRGDEDANVELAKCYLHGIGVRRSLYLGVRCLAAASSGADVFEATREEAAALLAQFRPKLITSQD